MEYQHHWLDGTVCALRPGKVVCVGRNYAEHARELGNAVPTEPILFMKPESALVAMHQPLQVPFDHGACHVETELAILIGAPLRRATESRCAAAVAGLAVAFDLTLRDMQATLKNKGYPWEVAKAFDGSCPLSGFVSPDGVDLSQVRIRLTRNGTVQQDGCSDAMLTPVLPLLAYISHWFSLRPGDVVLTGTPAGVGPLQSGDQLIAELVGLVRVATTVV
jgi:2-keto-4-pentenoate hydratase/2-oxohepta-3-ene-1,7-dioic acid hydratase in catechol pathway